MTDYIQFRKDPDAALHRRTLEKAFGGSHQAQLHTSLTSREEKTYGIKISYGNTELKTRAALLLALEEKAFSPSKDLSAEQVKLAREALFYTKIFSTPEETSEDPLSSEAGISIETTDIHSYEFLYKLEKILSKEAKVFVSSDKKGQQYTFTTKVFLDDKLLNKNELLNTLKFHLAKAQADVADALGEASSHHHSPHVEQLNQKVIDLLATISLIAGTKDKEPRGWRSGISKIGAVAAAALFGLIKGARYIQHHLLTINQEALALTRRIEGMASEVLQANRALRQALKSKDPDAPSFTALYRQYQKQPELLAKLKPLLVKKNTLLEAAFEALKNLFRGKKNKKLHYNNLLKSSLVHQKFADTNFIIKNGLYAEVTDDLLQAFSDISYASEADKREILTNLFHTAPDANGRERIIDYLVNSGRHTFAKELIGQDLAKCKEEIFQLKTDPFRRESLKIIENDLQDQSEALKKLLHNERAPKNPDKLALASYIRTLEMKYDSCRALAVRMGDSALLTQAFGFELEKLNLDDNKHLPKLPLDLLQGKNLQTKTLLHYAAKGNNAKLIQLVALCTENQLGIKNAFMVKDQAGDIPAHSIELKMAHQLDALYNLDGNKMGSFSSMAFYLKKTQLNVSSILRITSEIVGKAFGAAASTASIIFPPNFDVVTRAIAVNAPAYGGMGAGIGASLAIQKLATSISKLCYGIQLNLSQYEAKRQKQTSPFIVKAETKRELFQKKVIDVIHSNNRKAVIKTLNQAVKRRDAEAMLSLMYSLPDSWKPSATFIKAVNEMRYFPHDYRDHIMDMLFERCDVPDLIEKMMDAQIQYGGIEWVKNKVKELNSPIYNSSENIVYVHKKPLIMMAAKLGMKNVLETIDFPDDVLEWQNRNGETLLHLAAQSNDVPTIALVAQKMQQRLIEVKPDNQAMQYQVARSKQTALTLKEGLSTTGLAAQITGKKLLNGIDVFNLQNGHGKAVQDIISRDLMNRLDDYLLMPANEAGSMSDIGKLRAGEVAAEWVKDIGLVLPAKTALNFALANSLKLAVTSTFVTTSATHGIISGFFAAWSVEFATKLSLMIVGFGIELLMNWQAGALLYDIENAHRGYDNTITQLGATSKEVWRRFKYANDIDRKKEAELRKRLNRILALIMDDVLKEVRKQAIFKESEALQYLQKDMADCFSYNRSMPEILLKIAEIQKQAGFSEEQNKALANIIMQKFQPTNILASV